MEGAMKQAVRDALVASGITGDALAALEAKYPTRRKRVEINTDVCPACGTTAILSGDFCCGTCSEVKVRSERRFWQHAADLDAGFHGRPKIRKPKPQQLPPQVERKEFRLLVPVSDLPIVETKPEMREFLVTIGRVGLVVVAQYPYLAAREARLALKVGDTGGHAILDMGRVDATPTHYREFWTVEENTAAEESDAKKGAK
jgi:hypothetical protein